MSSFTNSCVILLLLLVVWIAPSSAISQEDINTVCSDPEIHDHSFCFTYFNIVPSLPTASLSSIVSMTGVSIVVDANQMFQLIKTLRKGNKTSDEMVALRRMEARYRVTANLLQDALRDFAMGDKDDLDRNLRLAISMIENIQLIITEYRFPMGKINLEIRNYLDVMLMLNKHLFKG